jgi:hypothetical protein
MWPPSFAFPPEKILQILSQWNTCIGRQHPFESGDIGKIAASTRIRSITGRHSLLPASYARISNSVPYGFACLEFTKAEIRAVHVPRY